MIVLAILILILILIIASTAVTFFNKAYPPCASKDYFRSARLLPDGSSAGLGSIQSGTDVDYVGFKLTSTDSPNSIGLKSRNSDYNPIDDQDNDLDNNDSTDYVDPDRVLYKQKIKKRIDQQLQQKTEVTTASKMSYDDKLDSLADSVLSEYFTEENKTKKETQEQNSQMVGKYKNQNIAMFEKIMEGVKAPNKMKKKSGNNLAAKQTATDGYHSMQPDKW